MILEVAQADQSDCGILIRNAMFDYSGDQALKLQV